MQIKTITCDIFAGGNPPGNVEIAAIVCGLMHRYGICMKSPLERTLQVKCV